MWTTTRTVLNGVLVDSAASSLGLWPLIAGNLVDPVASSLQEIWKFKESMENNTLIWHHQILVIQIIELMLAVWVHNWPKSKFPALELNEKRELFGFFQVCMVTFLLRHLVALSEIVRDTSGSTALIQIKGGNLRIVYYWLKILISFSFFNRWSPGICLKMLSRICLMTTSSL